MPFKIPGIRKAVVSTCEEKLQQQNLACKHIPLTLIPKRPYSLFCAVLCLLGATSDGYTVQELDGSNSDGRVTVTRGRTINRISVIFVILLGIETFNFNI